MKVERIKEFDNLAYGAIFSADNMFIVCDYCNHESERMRFEGYYIGHKVVRGISKAHFAIDYTCSMCGTKISKLYFPNYESISGFIIRS